MAELLLVGILAFVVGGVACSWLMLKAMRYVLRNHVVIQNLAVVYDAKRQPFAELCVDFPPMDTHRHPRVRIHPELAEELIAGMDRAEYPPTADIHAHMIRGRLN